MQVILDDMGLGCGAHVVTACHVLHAWWLIFCFSGVFRDLGAVLFMVDYEALCLQPLRCHLFHCMLNGLGHTLDASPQDK